MKKIYLAIVFVLSAMVAKAEVEFAYEAGAELVSAYLWRGQYNGGLSFQPDLEVGYDGEHTGLRVGAWGSLGATDWKFQKGLEKEDDYNPNTYFMPELDVIANFNFYGAQIGMTHYQYFIPEAKDNYQTEITVGYNFDDLLDVPLHISWNTIVAGNDYNLTENGEDEEGETVYDEKRAYSSYLEIGYDHTFGETGITLGGAIGISPWTSDFYCNTGFQVVNLSLRLEKEWDFDICSVSLFAQGSMNPSLEECKVYKDAAGDDKLCAQPLNGAIGLGIWF
ncbi:MAG: hypothetical protein MJZ64_03380 [Paludibacteraceae bacterium]|nr:hypothetical protein [Paludibacteraceae bacterium]